MSDAINLHALSLKAYLCVLELRAAGHRAVYVKRRGNGWQVGTVDAPGWALVLG